jgi:hypothetical protein
MNKYTPGPLRVVISSTCSGAWPEIVQDCVDTDTGEKWERGLGRGGTAFVERDNLASDDNGVYGGYDVAPGRFDPTDDCEEAMANARLWASAPELLEALIAAKSVVFVPSVMAILDAAIAKATGETK